MKLRIIDILNADEIAAVKEAIKIEDDLQRIKALKEITNRRAKDHFLKGIDADYLAYLLEYTSYLHC